MKLSVIIIAKNEEKRIVTAIKSVEFADEIIIIDDNSTDDTVAVAKKNRTKVFIHAKKNFAEQRNFGLQKATGDWVLYLDADEIVTPELAQEIQRALTHAPFVAYRIIRQNYYLGRIWPKTEKLERLFQKDQLKEWYGEVHESPKVTGSIGELTGVIVHDTHRSLSEMLQKTISWSEIEAQLRYDAKHPPVSWWRIPRVMVSAFWDFYIAQGGWRVGTVGLIESIYQAFSMFITYARLWELQQRKQ